MNQLLRFVEAKRVASSLRTFIFWAWTILEPDTPLCWSWHHDQMCEYLELVIEGEFRKRFFPKDILILNSPPRDGKSTVVSVCAPVYGWLKNPALQFLCASYNDKLAVDLSSKRRLLIRSDRFRELFDDRFQLREDRDRVGDFANDRGGHMIATSPDGATTGLGGAVLIADDLNSSEGAFSEAARRGTNNFVDVTWSTRKNNPAESVSIYVSQRLHEDDVTGHLLTTVGHRVVHVRVPLEAERDEEIVLPRSGRVVHRREGDVLEPERYTEEVVASLKLHPPTWAGQFQQRPAPAEGGDIKRADILFYREPPAKFDEVIISADCAFKSTKTSDFVAIHVWGVAGARFVLLDRFHARTDFPGTISALRTLSAKWPQATAKLIEDKANGSAIISFLKDEVSGLIPVNPEGGKESRVRAVTALFEAHNVYVPDPSIAPWIHDVIEEWCGFPHGAHDDDVDAMSQALFRLRLNIGTLGFVNYLKSGQAERDLRATPMASPTQPRPTSVVEREPSPACPSCSSQAVARCGSGYRCSQCAHQWGDTQEIQRGPNRKEIFSGSWRGRIRRF